MNFRPRGGAARRGRPATRPVYEDFKPSYEWKHEDGASILLYQLPGFAKEQIRIIAESKNVLRVRGERLIVANNKLSRFEEEVVVPQDCNMSEIRAKFEGGILTITMPKKMVTKVDTKHPIEEQTKPTFQRPPTPSVTRPNVQPNPQLHELQEEKSSKPTLPPIAQKPQFGTIVNPPPPTPWKGESAPQHERQQEAPTLPMKLPPTDNLKQPKFNQDNVYDDSKERFVQDRKSHEEDAAHIVGYKGGENVGTPTSHFRENEVKEKHMHDDEAIDEEKHEMYADAIDQERESKYDLSKMNKVDNYKQVKKSRLSKDSLNEDRKLLVNMGAAILVIFALGTSIVYSFGSSE